MKRTKPPLVAFLVILAALAAFPTAVLSTPPPGLVHYQGVLRDAADNPRNGSFDMVFRFFSAPAGGSEILVDRHEAAGTGAVPVASGLFGVDLGSGTLSDGTGPGVFSTLGEAFGSFSPVYVQIEVAGETLSPRIAVSSVAYALNAATLDGADPSEFAQLDAFNTFTSPTEFTSNLSVASIDFADGRFFQPLAGAIRLGAGNSASSSMILRAGDPTLDRPKIRLNSGGSGYIELKMGQPTSFTDFQNPSGVSVATVDTSGNVQMDGDVDVDGDTITFGSPGAKVEAATTTLNLVAGDADTDSMSLLAGNGTGDGAIILTGGGDVVIQVGGPTSLIDFLNDTGNPVTTVDSDGNLHLDGDAKVDGETITFGSPGAKVEAAATTLSLVAGDADTDSLFLESGNGNGDDGSIHLTGGGNVDIRTGGAASLVNFKNDSGLTVATVDASGNVQMNGNLTVSGGSIDQGGAGSIGIHAPLNVLVEADGSVRTMFDKDNNTGTQLAVWFHDGVYSNANELMELAENGNLRIRGTLSESVLFDLAESFFMAEPVEAGDLVRVDPLRPNVVHKTAMEGDAAAIGVVSTHPGVILGGAPFDAASLERAWGPEIAAQFASEQEEIVKVVTRDDPSLAADKDGAARVEGLALERFHERHFAPIALAGRVPVKVDASFGAIEVGDALTPSPVPGVAMKAVKPGPTVGKALEALHEGRGRILALVGTAWFAGATTGEALPEIGPAAGGGSTPHDDVARSGSIDARDPAATEPVAALPVSVETVPFSFPVAVREPVEPGDVLAADAAHPGQFALARRSADPAVVGIVAGGPQAAWRGRAPLALPGTIARCKVDASYAAILAGDPLVASATPGYAVASVDAKPGTVIGKALEPLESGTGTILVLVQQR